MLHDYMPKGHHPEYHYVEWAWNGPRNRNHAISIADLEKEKLTFPKDCYSTLMRFNGDFMDYMRKNSRIEGFRGSAYADWLYFDYDGHDRPLSEAIKESQDFLRSMEVNYDCDLNLIRIHISGGGIHAGLPSRWFDLEPSAKLPQIIKRILRELAVGTVDHSIYYHSGFIRLPATYNTSSHRWKREVSTIDLLTRPHEMVRLAEQGPGEWSDPQDMEQPDPNPKLVELYQRVKTEIEKRGRRPIGSGFKQNDNSGSYSGYTPRCILRIMLYGVAKGDRQRASLRIAQHYRDKGTPLEITIDILCEWDKKNVPPREDHELITYERAASNVYAHDYSWGCKDSEIRAKYCCGALCRIYKGHDKLPEVRNRIKGFVPSLEESEFIQLFKEEGMANQENGGKVVKRFSIGTVSATVWENVGNDETKKAFKSVSIERSYRDANGDWQKASGFNMGNLSALADIIRRVKDEFMIEVQEPEPKREAV